MTPLADRRLRFGLGAAAASLLVAFLAGAFAVLAVATGTLPEWRIVIADPYIRSVVLFTLEQASLSTLLSLAGAVPLAVALHRTRFFGRQAVLRLFLLPQALPVLVGGLAIIAIWGRNGIISDGLTMLGLRRLDVYGLPGILLAHVFFNLPLAARMMVVGLDRVPEESWKLAGQLALSPAATFRIVEWPAIRSSLPGAASLVFMLCVTSFTLVLVLGGGPAATTLEVAIYQSLRYDFDPARAVGLSLLQIMLTAVILFLASRLGGEPTGGFGLGGRARRYDAPSLRRRLLDAIVLAVGVVFVLSPFVAVVVRGLAADLPALLRDPAVLRAAATSTGVAFAAALLSLLVSLPIALAVAAGGGTARGHAGRQALETAASLVLVVPPIVVGAGWFLALRQVTDVFAAAPYVVIAINAAMAVPFVVRIVGPSLAEAEARNGRLAASLGLVGRTRFRIVDWPTVRVPLALAFAFALALSLGDLGAVALFGNDRFVTLPYLLLQRMGSYRTHDAAGLALILGVLCLALMLVAERAPGLGRRQP